MPDVYCDRTDCRNNEISNMQCMAATISFDVVEGCTEYDDITKGADYQSKYYELIMPSKQKEQYFKRAAKGKKYQFAEFTLYTQGDYRDDDSRLTEEKSGLNVGSLFNFKDEKHIEKVRGLLAEHLKTFKPVADYPEE